MAADPLLIDVLCDPRTMAVGYGEFIRAGVIYSFTQEELLEAQIEMAEKIKRSLEGGL